VIKIDKGKCQGMATSLGYMIPYGRSVLVTVEGLKAFLKRGAKERASFSSINPPC